MTQIESPYTTPSHNDLLILLLKDSRVYLFSYSKVPPRIKANAIWFTCSFILQQRRRVAVEIGGREGKPFAEQLILQGCSQMKQHMKANKQDPYLQYVTRSYSSQPLCSYRRSFQILLTPQADSDAIGRFVSCHHANDCIEKSPISTRCYPMHTVSHDVLVQFFFSTQS